MNDAEDLENVPVEKCLLSLSHEVAELGIGTNVPEIDVEDISPLSFYREHVSPNLPVLIHNGCGHWPALKKWSDEYLCNILNEKYVTVAVTPNGYADAIAKDQNTDLEFFVMPEERSMKMSHFVNVLNNPHEFPGVFYLQHQNSNLSMDLPELLKDVDENIAWATEAFGQPPDAVNFWMGDQRAVTSLHKDPYENIYCVVRGFKDFILFPPTDLPWIPYKSYPTATYKENSAGEFDIIPTRKKGNPRLEGIELHNANSSVDENVEHVSQVPWICIDPLAPNLNKYPLYRHTSPVHVRVHAGDILFLPSLWFHHVCQSHKCVAVNYWYDMQYDIKYAYYKFLESVSKLTT